MINYLHVDCDLYVGTPCHFVMVAIIQVYWSRVENLELLATAGMCNNTTGAKDVFTMLEDRILPGAIVVFDEVRRGVTIGVAAAQQCGLALLGTVAGTMAVSLMAVLLLLQLVNYPAYRDHEVKAMWEWLRRTGRKLEVIGIMGPLQQVLRVLTPSSRLRSSLSCKLTTTSAT